MREVFFLKGKKVAIANLNEANALVKLAYPKWDGTSEGSYGSHHWKLSNSMDTNNEIIAEAWLRDRVMGWWLVIKFP